MLLHPFCPQFFMHQGYLSFVIKNSKHVADHSRSFGAETINARKFIFHAVRFNFRKVVCRVK
jgi:hypothetical protein